MTKILEDIQEEIEGIQTTIEENEEITNTVLELVLSVKARLEAIEELLVGEKVLDLQAIETLHEVNFLEAVHELSNKYNS